MVYRVIVEQRTGKLPDVTWRVVFEREVSSSVDYDLKLLIGNLHLLYSSMKDHRVLVISDFDSSVLSNK